VPQTMALGHGGEPRLGERRGLKHVGDVQTRATPRQPLAVREPRPTKFGYRLSAIGDARSACYSPPAALIDAAAIKGRTNLLYLS
jgi:hypothetical protein